MGVSICKLRVSFLFLLLFFVLEGGYLFIYYFLWGDKDGAGGGGVICLKISIMVVKVQVIP